MVSIAGDGFTLQFSQTGGKAMNRILTLFVSLHWTIVFAALALLAGLHGGENFGAVLASIGIQFPVDALPMPVPAALCALLAVGFGIVGALFLWMFVTGAFDRRIADNEADEVARLAFGGAVGIFTVVFVGCATASEASGLYRSVAVEMGALLVSYLAVCAERRMVVAAAETREAESVGNAARNMALHAVHDSLVARLAGGRNDGERG